MANKWKRFAQFAAVLIVGAAAVSQDQLAFANAYLLAEKVMQNATGSATPADTSHWKTYRNDAYGFEVKYPDTWHVNASSGSGPVMVSISGPSQETERPSLSLAIQPNQNPGKLSIEAWFAEQLRKMGVKPESSGSVTIGGQAAVFMENTNSFGKRHDIFTLLNTVDVLSLGYRLKPEYDSTYQSIISSFHLTK